MSIMESEDRIITEPNISVQTDVEAGIPLYLQIKHQFVYLISTGEVPVGAKLPSVRRLASRLGVTPRTVAQAYRALQEDGLVQGSRGRGTIVQDIGDAPNARRSEAQAEIWKMFESALEFGRNRGFTRNQLTEMFLSVASHSRTAPRVVLLERSPWVVRRYRERLKHYLGDLIVVESFTFEGMQSLPPEQQSVISESHFIATLSGNLPFLRRVFPDVQKQFELLTLTVSLTPESVSRLSSIANDAKIVVFSPERSLHGLIGEIIQHTGLPLSQIQSYSTLPEKSLDELVDGADIVFYTTGSRDFLKPEDFKIQAYELLYDISSDTVFRLRALFEY